MSWIQMIQNATQIFTGALGGGLVILGVICTGIYSIFHGHWGWFYSALGGGAVVIGASWLVQTVYGVTG